MLSCQFYARSGGLTPTVSDRGSCRTIVGVGQSICILQRAQDSVVRNGFAIPTDLDHGTNKNGGDLVILRAIILIPCHNQQAIVGLRPLDIGIDVQLEPAIGLLDGAIVHIIIDVRSVRLYSVFCIETFRVSVGGVSLSTG